MKSSPMLMRIGCVACVCATLCGCGKKQSSSNSSSASSSSVGVNQNGSPRNRLDIPTDPEVLKEPVTGQVMGKIFRPERIEANLTDSNPAQLHLQFMAKTADLFDSEKIGMMLPVPLGLAPGQVIEFGGDKDTASVFVESWPKDEPVISEMISPANYRLRLNIDSMTEETIHGTIDLRVSEPSGNFLAGTFSANYTPPAPSAPRDSDKPFIAGKVLVTGDTEEMKCSCRFIGLTSVGEQVSNSAGMALWGSGSMVSETHSPQLSSIHQADSGEIFYKHTKLAPGQYLVCVYWEGVFAASKLVTVSADTGLTLDIPIDTTTFGELTIELPEQADQSHTVGPSVIPAELDSPFRVDDIDFRVELDEEDENSVTLPLVAPGRYTIRWKQYQGEVQVQANESTSITLQKTKD